MQWKYTIKTESSQQYLSARVVRWSVNEFERLFHSSAVIMNFADLIIVLNLTSVNCIFSALSVTSLVALNNSVSAR